MDYHKIRGKLSLVAHSVRVEGGQGEHLAQTSVGGGKLHCERSVIHTGKTKLKKIPNILHFDNKSQI